LPSGNLPSSSAGGFDETLVTYDDFDLSNKLAKHGTIKFIDNAYVASSTRRIVKYGIFQFAFSNLENVVMYNLFRKPKYYEPIR
jgi:hypothetical protein